MTATLNKSLVEKRGHKIPETYPFIINSSVENLARTQDVEKMLKVLGFEKEMERSMIKKVRAGLGTMRGRKYRRKKGGGLVFGLVTRTNLKPGVPLKLKPDEILTITHIRSKPYLQLTVLIKDSVVEGFNKTEKLRKRI